MVDQPLAIKARLDSLFAPAEGGSVSIRGAARKLGLSRDTVRRMMGGEKSPKGLQALHAAEQADRRKPAWLGGHDTGKSIGVLFARDQRPTNLPGDRDVRSQIEFIAARTAKGGIDRESTGRALGVSGRTISRWISGTSRPKQAHQEEIRREVRATHLANSDAAMDRAYSTTPLKIRFTARISSDTRDRTVSRRFDPQAMREAQLAWINSGEEGLSAFLSHDLKLNYFGSSAPDAEVTSILDTSS